MKTHRTRARRGPNLALALALLVVACGGASTQTTGGPGAATGGNGTGSTTGPGGPSATQPSDGGATTPAPGGPASVAEPCTLLTAADIEQASGFRPIRQLAHSGTPGDVPAGCEWDLDNPGETPWAIVLGVRSPGGSTLSLSEGEPLEGVGDAAVQVDGFVVEAIKGDTYITITYMEFPERAEVPVELARRVLEKV